MNDDVKPKSEHEKIMDKRMYDIDVEIANQLSKDINPEVFICNHKTIAEILDAYCDADLVRAMNWKEPVAFAFANGEVELRILRTIDLPDGAYIIK